MMCLAQWNVEWAGNTEDLDWTSHCGHNVDFILFLEISLT